MLSKDVDRRSNVFSERSLFCSFGRFYALWDIKKASGKPKTHTLT
ncbi:MAG: hypothetical protein AVDCRST_MAG96-133 [uncultured Segetibacter sp.]|uniref:Uncharacterized protein n=1 Tax=uncultured Segetibacter sp. TaxID=481133 RepID=A0A6J4R8W6_9BACT|nr:MAG: hypothetical protein AVDCRST_MAG96-133 [uncultured Segetibacter sp.]